MVNDAETREAFFFCLFVLVCCGWISFFTSVEHHRWHGTHAACIQVTIPFLMKNTTNFHECAMPRMNAWSGRGYLPYVVPKVTLYVCVWVSLYGSRHTLRFFACGVHMGPSLIIHLRKSSFCIIYQNNNNDLACKYVKVFLPGVRLLYNH